MIDDHRIGAEVIDVVGDVVQRIRRAASALGGTVRLDAREELTSRMTSTGWRPNGRASAGGSCRLLRSGDGSWIALNLARPEDIESLPALFERELAINDGIAPWSGDCPLRDGFGCASHSPARDRFGRAGGDRR